MQTNHCASDACRWCRRNGRVGSGAAVFVMRSAIAAAKTSGPPAERTSRARMSRPRAARTSSSRATVSTPSFAAIEPSSNRAIGIAADRDAMIAVGGGADAHIRRKRIEVQHAAAIDRHGDFWRQSCGERAAFERKTQVGRQRACIENLRRIEFGERDCVATAMPSATWISSAPMAAAKLPARCRAQAANLDVAARGDFDDAIAVAQRCRAQSGERLRARRCRPASAAPASRRQSPSVP